MSCMFQPQQLQGHKEGRGTALLGCVAISLHHQPRHPPPPQALLPLPKSKASSCCCSGHTALVGTFWLSTVYFSLEQTLLTPLLGKNEVRQMEVSQNPPAGPYSAENQKRTYIYFRGPISSFFTRVIYWLVHVCFVPEEKTLPPLWKVHIKWLKEHYLPYQFHQSL